MNDNEQCLAEKFANMMVITNDLPDLRKKGMEEFYQQTKRSLVVEDSLFALFLDNSMAMSVMGEITVMENIEEEDTVAFLIRYFLDLNVKHPELSKKLIGALINDRTDEEKVMIDKEVEEIMAKVRPLMEYGHAEWEAL